MKEPYQIPADIYDRVHEAMLAIVNASQTGDDVLCAVHYEQFRVFCEEQTAAGRGSGFLWEALADVTVDPADQLACYERALVLAHHNAEPTHTALLAMGRIHAEAGDWPQAEPLLLTARQQAIVCDDETTEGEAAAVLLQKPSDEA